MSKCFLYYIFKLKNKVRTLVAEYHDIKTNGMNLGNKTQAGDLFI